MHEDMNIKWVWLNIDYHDNGTYLTIKLMQISQHLMLFRSHYVSDFAGFRFKIQSMFIQAKDAHPIYTTRQDVGRNVKLTACAGIQNIQLD